MGGAYNTSFIRFQLQAIEYDSIPDVGWIDEEFSIQQMMLDGQFYLQVLVEENRGRYAGNVASIKFYFDIKREVESGEVWSNIFNISKNKEFNDDYASSETTTPIVDRWLETQISNDSSTEEQTLSNDQETTSTDNYIKHDSNIQSDQKLEYKLALDKIAFEFEEISNSVTTVDEMYQTTYKTYKKFDDLLNEIYETLIIKLSQSDMEKLRKEERQWIIDRDAKAEEDTANMASSTMKKILYQKSLANSTKERCYVLLDTYMK
ncbi:lysozyme inhibitor LprI family protein [Lysinibacillus sp. ZYM-1]|uniref:lysozyme inhibitor LprI family protein n=1 Tax=Lysinibacillus sp. ZYM-1 TaxID=1681184 RepID=UPI0006CE720C|nr:lysozyme inhibitor LprI family protein [Lysinibacillus sp. ZYM-1]KPN96528.1 hypothetical protein AO843_16535 [Lysinibacillus sp. ZYM-1]